MSICHKHYLPQHHHALHPHQQSQRKIGLSPSKWKRDGVLEAMAKWWNIRLKAAAVQSSHPVLCHQVDSEIMSIK